MKKSVGVTVYWENDRYSNPPESLQYTAIAWFQENRDIIGSGTWNIVLDFEVPPCEQGSPSNGTAHFLVEDAPHEWLKPGNSFEMHEEKFKSATVFIKGD